MRKDILKKTKKIEYINMHIKIMKLGFTKILQ